MLNKTYITMFFGILLICVFTLIYKKAVPVYSLNITTLKSLEKCQSHTNSRPGNYYAMVAEDGTTLALKCPDEKVVTWREDTESVSIVENTSMFDAATRLGIVPNNLHCTNRAHTHTFDPFCIANENKAGLNFPECHAPEYGLECFILDHSPNSTDYILHDTLDAFVASTTSDSLLGIGFMVHPGVLLPRSGAATTLIFVDGRGYINGTKKLSSISLKDGTVTELVHFHNNASSVHYSDAHSLLITTFGESFYGPTTMSYVVANTLDGAQKWNIEGPTSPGPGASGAYLSIKIFSGGRYATLHNSNTEYSFDVIDLENGAKVGTILGHPLAVSGSANRILVVHRNRTFSVLDLMIKRTN